MWNIIVLTIFTFFYTSRQVHACNEAVCASIISKCLLTQSCQCNFKNCSCCKDCFSCLGDLYIECCSCLDMCPKSNTTSTDLSRKSYLEHLTEPVDELFKVLTEYPDPNRRWHSKHFTVAIDMSQYSPKKEIKIHMQSAEQGLPITQTDMISVNCTVAFMSKCMSVQKCRRSCETMGASTIRWFHDGCCECVGRNCLNYGIDESRCRECPMKNEKEDINVDDDYYDYGEDYDEED